MERRASPGASPSSGRSAPASLLALALALALAGCGTAPSGSPEEEAPPDGAGCPLVCGAGEAVDAVACACVAVCGEEACRVGERCAAGSCTCEGGGCADGSSCSPATGRCEPGAGCECPAGERCDAAGACVPDELGCDPVCGEGERCSGGAEPVCSCDPAEGGCPAGSSCDPGTLRCTPVPGCEPACTQSQACAGTPPRCVPGCSVAVCGAGEVCDPRLGACVQDACAGVPACPDGEVCDPATGACGADLCLFAGCAGGESCDPLAGGCACDPADDRCSTGRSCDPATLRCVTSDLPQEYESCNAAEGCAPGLSCLELGGQGRLCLATCARTADCATLFDYCQADLGLCLPNSCGPGGQTQPGSPFYGACDGVAEGSGYCVPVDDGAGGSLGLCVDGGTAPEGAPCADDASRNDPTQACPAGFFCFATCTPICDPRLDGACPVGTGCLELDPAPDPWGICTEFAPCAGVTCAEGLTCDQLDGSCKDACGNRCDAFQRCDPGSGACVVDGCGAGCGAGARCVNEACEPYACWGVVCDGGSACDPVSGVCEGGCAQACAQGELCSLGLCLPALECLVSACGAGDACDPRLTPASCVPLPGAGEPCDPVLGCGDRQRCVEQDGAYACRQACAATADCPDPTTACLGGACAVSYCGPGTVAGGALLGPCDGEAHQSGSCVPTIRDGGEVGICHDGGNASSSCLPEATRDLRDVLCRTGTLCSGPANDPRCSALCDPASRAGCDGGQSCVRQPEGFGLCVDTNG